MFCAQIIRSKVDLWHLDATYGTGACTTRESRGNAQCVTDLRQRAYCATGRISAPASNAKGFNVQRDKTQGACEKKKKWEWLVDFCFFFYLPSPPFFPSKPHCLSSAPPSNTLTVVCFPFVFPLHTNSLSPSLKSRLYNLRHSLPSLAPLRTASRQMLRFNALIWPAVSSSVSLILIHLVPSKTLWSNLGKLALAQTNRRLWDSTVFFFFPLSALWVCWHVCEGAYLDLFCRMHACRRTGREGTDTKRKDKTSLASTNGIVHTQQIRTCMQSRTHE